jgi:hypothetical protein
MKTIQPVTVWYNGQEKQATILSVVASSDNLISSANFSYQLLAIINPELPYIDNSVLLNSGGLYMTGEAYQNWQTNDYAYDWVASQLNLVITGEYVPPTPPQPEPPQPEILEPNA